jgi:hypothetical protein
MPERLGLANDSGPSIPPRGRFRRPGSRKTRYPTMGSAICHADRNRRVDDHCPHKNTDIFRMTCRVLQFSEHRKITKTQFLGQSVGNPDWQTFARVLAANVQSPTQTTLLLFCLFGQSRQEISEALGSAFGHGRLNDSKQRNEYQLFRTRVIGFISIFQRSASCQYLSR